MAVGRCSGGGVVSAMDVFGRTALVGANAGSVAALAHDSIASALRWMTAPLERDCRGAGLEDLGDRSGGAGRW
jgi:hypothetical protein